MSGRKELMVLYSKFKKFLLSEKFVLVLIIFLAAVLRLNALTHWVFSSPFPSMGSEATPINTALRMFENRTLNVNLPTNNYQPLLIYANAAVYALTFTVSLLVGIFRDVGEMRDFFILDRAALVLISRILVGLLSTASVYFLYRAVKRLFNSVVGLVAAFFFAVGLLHIAVSHIATVWTPMLLFLILAFDQAVAVFKTGDSRAYFLSALFAVLSYGSHNVGGIAIVPLIAAHFLRQEKALSKKSVLDKQLILSGALFVLSIIFFFALNPMPLLANLGGEEIEMLKEAGFDYFTHYYDFFYYTFQLLFRYHPLLSILSLLGILMLVIRKRRKEVLLILALPFLYYLFLGPLTYAWQVRFFVIFIPFVAMLAAYTVVHLVERVKIKTINLKKLFLVIMTILVAVPSLYITGYWSLLMRKKTTSELAQEWIYENIPSDSKILLNQLSGPFFLEQNREYLVFIKEVFGDGALTQRQKFMLELPKTKYPQPAYFPLKTDLATGKMRDEIFKKYKFDYYIAVYRNIDVPAHGTAQILKQKELVKSFKPNYESKLDIQNLLTVLRPFEVLPKIHGTHGNIIEIYKLWINY